MTTKTWNLEAAVVTLLQAEPQSTPTLAKTLYDQQGINYLDLILTDVPNLIKDLLADGVITSSHSKQYFCGAGKCMAVEWFYKLV